MCPNGRGHCKRAAVLFNLPIQSTAEDMVIRVSPAGVQHWGCMREFHTFGVLARARAEWGMVYVVEAHGGVPGGGNEMVGGVRGEGGGGDCVGGG